MTLAQGARDAVAAYEAHRHGIAELSAALQHANAAIRVTKEQAAAGNPAAIAADLSRLKAVKARHSVRIAALCHSYLAEKAAKTETEQQRDQNPSHARPAQNDRVRWLRDRSESVPAAIQRGLPAGQRDLRADKGGGELHL